MSEKRYQLRHEDLDYPCYSDLVDTEDNDKVICTFNNDSGTNKMVVLLNELSEENKQLKREVKRLKCINKQLEERLDKDIALNMDCGDVE